MDFFGELAVEGSWELELLFRDLVVVGVGSLQTLLDLVFEVLDELFGAKKVNSEARFLDRDSRGFLLGLGSGEPML